MSRQFPDGIAAPRGSDRRLAIIGMIAGFVVVAAGARLVRWCLDPPSLASCQRAANSAEKELAVERCLERYDETEDGDALYWAVKASLGGVDTGKSTELALLLLRTSHFGYALEALGYIALKEQKPRIARLYNDAAARVCADTGDRIAQTRNLTSSSSIAWTLGEYESALELADRALAEISAYLSAPGADEKLARSSWRNASIARADALRRMGDANEAVATLREALRRELGPCDKAWVLVKLAMSYEEDGDEDRLAKTLDAVEREQCSDDSVLLQLKSNRALLLRYTDSRRALALLDEVDQLKGSRPLESSLLRGQIAARHGNLEEARQHLKDAAGKDVPDADWPWEVEQAMGELEEADGNPALAETFYRSSIKHVLEARGEARSRAAYLMDSHRGPYDSLIALLARDEKWRDALAVILELDASDMLQAMASHPGKTISGEAPAPSQADRRVPVTVDEVLAAWRGRDLVIVIAPAERKIGGGKERAYRLELRDGQVTGQDIGLAREVERWAAELASNPQDRSAAKELASRIVPDGAASEPLDVLGIGKMSKVPLGALLDGDGSPSSLRRPLQRALALWTATPPAVADGPSVILADSAGDLPSAADEGRTTRDELVAEEPERPVQLLLGSEATRERLLGVGSARLLYVATHVDIVRGQGHVLRMADGSVTPAELVGRGVAPYFAVLAACTSGTAKDEEGWGSPAAALLEAGTVKVLATDRKVNDAATARLMKALRAEPGWQQHPEQALARAQQEAARGGLTVNGKPIEVGEWAAFTVIVRPPYIARQPASALH